MKRLLILLTVWVLFFSGTTPIKKMACNRFWVGGSGDWSDSFHWSEETGGLAGATVPEGGCYAVFNEGSGSGTVNIDIEVTGVSIEIGAGYEGDISGSQNFHFDANLIIIDGSSMSGFSYTGTFIIEGGGSYINAQNIELVSIEITGNAGLQALSSLTIGSSYSLIITEGTFNSTGNNLTAGHVIANNPGIARYLDFSSGGIITLTGTGDVWDCSHSGDISFYPPDEIHITDGSSSVKSFIAGGLVYNALYLEGGGDGSFDIIGGASFTNLNVEYAPATVRFEGASVYIFYTGFNTVGSSGNLTTITSTGAATHELINSTGSAISQDYLDVSWSIVTNDCNSAEAWFAGTHSTNSGNNVGWFFTAPGCPPAGLSALGASGN